jgi:hypothetical protein
MRNWKSILFILSGVIPVLGLLSRPPDTMLLIYTVFVAGYLCRSKLAVLIQTVPGRFHVHLCLLFLISGSLTEALAWSNNYLKATENPALFHPQLIPDLIIGIGFYGGWAIAWWVALRWFHFTAAEGFLVTGIQGIFFEQLGAVFMAMLGVFKDNPGFALLMGLYVFLVHGSITGIALTPLSAQMDLRRKSRHWVRFPVVIVLMVFLAFAGSSFINLFAESLGGLPPKRSITEHPFW